MACEEVDTSYSRNSLLYALHPSLNFHLAFSCYLFRLSRPHTISWGLSLWKKSCKVCVCAQYLLLHSPQYDNINGEFMNLLSVAKIQWISNLARNIRISWLYRRNRLVIDYATGVLVYGVLKYKLAILVKCRTFLKFKIQGLVIIRPLTASRATVFMTFLKPRSNICFKLRNEKMFLQRSNPKLADSTKRGCDSGQRAVIRHVPTSSRSQEIRASDYLQCASGKIDFFQSTSQYYILWCSIKIT